MSLCDPMDYTVHGILQARILEWVAFPFSRRSSQPKDWTQVSRIAGRRINLWAIREAEYADYIMRNAGLEEAQAGIRIAGRNINNLKYADDITLWQKAKRN